MKCPYMRIILDYTDTSMEYNSDNLVTKTIAQNVYINNMKECLQDNCAAWRDGKCCYRER